MTDDLYEAALEAATAEPVAWMPHKDDEQPRAIAGVFVHEGVTEDKGYGASSIVTLRERSGRYWSVRLYGKVLAREWKDAAPHIGDVVGVSYRGEQKAKDGTDFRNYRVRVMRTGEPVLTDQQQELLERADELAGKAEPPSGGTEPPPPENDADDDDIAF